jgi:signal transduction histidine kinase/ActR/RegA family two-component response regulator
VWTEVVACYWYDHETGRIELHGVTRDVSERKRAESEKDHLQKQLVQAQKMESVGRLAGGVAHDFNNMLQGILGYAEMALDQVDPGDRLHGDIKEIQKVAERSADLTKQLLAFARRQTVVPRVVDLNEVVSEVLSMLRRLIGEEIRLAWHPHEGLWPVKLDPSQIGMALANLCVNSRDAISGPGRITIESHNVAVDEVYCTSHPDAFVGDYAMVSVSDTGCGIAREVLPQVFDPFFTTKDVDKGTGLGLATVHGIVLQNEGFVNAYSEVGRGTTFRIYFPRHLEPVPEPVAAAPRAQVPGGTETVLVVEDEPSLLRMCGEVLRRLGYDVLLASHPEMALALAEGPGQRIDLLMTDVVMPDMNGRELATRLAVGHPGLSCLYMSGYPESAISHHGIVEEGLEFIPKPFSRRALADKVRKILDERGMGG